MNKYLLLISLILQSSECFADLINGVSSVSSSLASYSAAISADWSSTSTNVSSALSLIATGNFSTKGYQLNTSGTQPGCDVDHRGLVWNVQGALGVADVMQVCQKTALNAYAWAVH